MAGAPVVDALPAAVTGATWTCVPAGASTCGAGSGSGSINTTVNLVAGGSATFTVVATISQTATGALDNTATIGAPGGVVDPDATNNSATDTDSLTPTVDLAIVKADGQATAVPGSADTYTITITNSGPSAATGASVTDTLPGIFTGATWTCTANLGSCPASGSGDIGTTVDIQSGGTVTFTLTGTIAPGASGQLVNTVTVTAPSGTLEPNTNNNSATDTDTLTPQADLVAAKSDGVTAVAAGTPVTYTITITNNGPSSVMGAPVSDTVPGALNAVSWSCSAGSGSTCGAAGGTGSIATTVDLLPGGVATFTVDATVSPAATGTLVNTATVATPTEVTELTPGDNSATDTDTITLGADLAISKTHEGDFVVGQTGSFTIMVTNNGPADSLAPVVVDTLPAGLTFASGGNGTWTCAAVGQVVTCNMTATLLTGTSSSFPLAVTVDQAALPSVINSAQVSSETPDGSPANNVSSDTVSVTFVDLSLTKTLVGALKAGSQATYTLAIHNAGTATSFGGITLVDTLPAELTYISASGSGWTCSGSGNLATCTTAAVVAPGASLPDITLIVNVAAGAVGSIVNHGIVTTSGDFNVTNDSATSGAEVVVQAPRAAPVRRWARPRGVTAPARQSALAGGAECRGGHSVRRPPPSTALARHPPQGPNRIQEGARPLLGSARRWYAKRRDPPVLS